MTNEWTADADPDLADALRALGHRLDPEPDALAAAAVAAYSCRTPDAEVAALTYDSVLDDGLPGRLTFAGRGVTVEVEVSERRVLTGRLVPAGPAQIEVRWPGGSAAAVTDDLGRFRLPAIPPGPVSIGCESDPNGVTRSIVTDWFML